MEREIERSRDELERLLASHDELVGSIAHDLKGLLSGTEGGLYMIKSGLEKDKPERLDQGMAMLRRNLHRIRKTVASVLYYVKPRQVNRQPIELGKLIESVGGELSDHAEQLEVSLNVEAANGSFEADDFAVFSLLVNLVEYALHGCSLNKTGETRAVSVKALVNGEDTVFEVMADGFSMEDEVREIAFGRYYIPRGVDRSHLGLFIAHKLALSHGGSLTAESLPSAATRFTVTLPVDSPDAGSHGPDASGQKSLAEEWEGRK